VRFAGFHADKIQEYFESAGDPINLIPQFNLTADIADDADAEICRASRASNQFTGRVKPANCSMPWLSADIHVIRGFNREFWEIRAK
jgi:hypothetical protein